MILPCLNKFLLYCIVLYCIVLYCIVLYCIVLYCIVLYCIVLYCIVHLQLNYKHSKQQTKRGNSLKIRGKERKRNLGVNLDYMENDT